MIAVCLSLGRLILYMIALSVAMYYLRPYIGEMLAASISGWGNSLLFGWWFLSLFIPCSGSGTPAEIMYGLRH